MHNHSYENELNYHVNEISSSYEKMGTKARFEEEAKGNLEMAYYTCHCHCFYTTTHPPPLPLPPSSNNERFWNDFDGSTKKCARYVHVSNLAAMCYSNTISITLIVTSAVHVFSGTRLTSRKKL